MQSYLLLHHCDLAKTAWFVCFSPARSIVHRTKVEIGRISTKMQDFFYQQNLPVDSLTFGINVLCYVALMLDVAQLIRLHYYYRCVRV